MSSTDCYQPQRWPGPWPLFNNYIFSPELKGDASTCRVTPLEPSVCPSWFNNWPSDHIRRVQWDFFSAGNAQQCHADRYDGAFERIPTSGFSAPIFTSAPIDSQRDWLCLCLWNWVVVVHLECCLAEFTDNREVSQWCPHSTSPSLKVRCNKIAAAGIINELELQGGRNSFLIYETLTNWQPHWQAY